jgi:hypothetical protein
VKLRKNFGAVAESRKWRETTSRKLDAMSSAERMAYLKATGERVRAELRARHPAVPVAP